MSRPAKESSGYRPDVDGLRAFAVLAVLAFHAFPTSLPGGFVGVDVFFVISGFLITGILLRQDKISIRDFYIRRVKRIFPALAIVLFTVLCLGWFLLLPAELAALGKYTASGSLFSANISLWRDSGYFDTASETKPLLHLWSLGVEEQYYFVWPLFLALMRPRRGFIPALVGTAFLSFGLCLWATSHARSAAFYLPMTRFWELAVGGGLAIWYGRRRTTPSWVAASAAAWAGVVLLAAAVTLISQRRDFPGTWALLPVVGTALLVGGGSATFPARVLSTPVFVAVGVISYPLYLWHWPLLTYGRILVGDGLSPTARLAICAVSVLLATATYRLVERKVRQGRALWTRPWVLLVSVAMVGLAGAGAFVSDGFPFRTAAIPSPQARSQHDGALCPAALKDGEVNAINMCWSTGPSPATAAIVGDSHALFLSDGLVEQGEGWVFLGNASCPPLLGVDTVSDLNGCAEKFKRILDYLRSREASAVKTVFVTFYSGYALDEAYAADHLQNHLGPDHIAINGYTDRAHKEPLFVQGLEAYLVALMETGKRIILIEDVPEFPNLPGQCQARPAFAMWLRDQLGGPRRCALSRASVEKRQSSYLAMTARLAAKYDKLSVFHMLDHICSPSGCAMLGPGRQLLYYDSHHISVEGGRMVAPAIWNMARGQAPGP